MDRCVSVSCSGIVLAGMALLGSVHATAASVDLNTTSICKSKVALFERATTAGVVFAHCVVDIRMANLREYMSQRIQSGEHDAVMLPVFRGSASARLVLIPSVVAMPYTASAIATGLQDQLSQPFSSLETAMADFTGQGGLKLDLGDPPPWAALPGNAGSGNYLLQTSFNVQSQNAIPQAVVPLPSAVGLFVGGLFALGGLVWQGRRRVEGLD